jgi:BirA family transcriptional regulator, biotin operon repressor / biotin---[acetyl-CoA-carboxylase] ligase
MEPREPIAGDLSEERLAAGLAGLPPRSVRVLASTTSTNDEALRWADEGAPDGGVVVADHQTAGRGRRGRTWWSEPGRSLLFSVILRPTRPAGQLGLLTTALGVASARGIESLTSLRLRLKWPNDLTVGDRKLGGILVETRVAGARVDVAIAGLGINVFDMATAPDEVAVRSTSLVAELGRAPDRTDLLVAILEAFEHLYPALDPATILSEASARSAVLGRQVVVTRSDGTSARGKATSLLPSGALELTVGTDRIEIGSGEVAIVREP